MTRQAKDNQGIRAAPEVPTLTTARLHLRPWTAADREPFAALNADPVVMEFLPSALTRAESDDLADRIEEHLCTRGFGFWAVEVTGEASFVGMIGLAEVSFRSHFTPAVEIGWRLARHHWGKGYAIEGARAAARFGFEHLSLKEIVALTVPANARSRRVMERLGMTHDPRDDFLHPRLPAGHPLQPHVLYRLSRFKPPQGRAHDECG